MEETYAAFQDEADISKWEATIPVRDVSSLGETPRRF